MIKTSLQEDWETAAGRAGCRSGRSLCISRTPGGWTRSRSQADGAEGEDAQNKPTAGDRTVVSTARGSFNPGDFDELNKWLRAAPE